MQTTVFWTIHWNLLKPLYKFEFLDPTLHENKGRGRGRPRKTILTEEAATASTEDADDGILNNSLKPS
jgi:hypothetical protein